jgi:predicted adenine nucleotide alpha hydrolase (AANH) superfamily ATPase
LCHNTRTRSKIVFVGISIVEDGAVWQKRNAFQKPRAIGQPQTISNDDDIFVFFVCVCVYYNNNNNTKTQGDQERNVKRRAKKIGYSNL